MNPNFDNIINSASSGGKIDKEALKKAAQTGDGKALLGSLSPEDQKKIAGILTNKAAMENLMKNPQVISLMKKLSGGEKNG